MWDVSGALEIQTQPWESSFGKVVVLGVPWYSHLGGTGEGLGKAVKSRESRGWRDCAAGAGLALHAAPWGSISDTAYGPPGVAPESLGVAQKAKQESRGAWFYVSA